MALFIDGYEIDVETSADVDASVVVSEFPVEKGANISDHARAQPLRLRVEGIVSNTPLSPLAARRAVFSLVNGEAFALPADEAKARLMAIRDAGEPVTVECSLGTFDNMVMESFTPTATTLECLQFSAAFVQIILVTNERTTVLVKSRAKGVNLGHRPSTEAPAAPPPSAAASDMATSVPPSLTR